MNNGPYGTSGFSFTHGWALFILPYVEQQPLHDLYRWDFPLYAPENQPVVATHLKLFQCPSAPEQNRYMTFGPFDYFRTRGACGDYTITLGVDPELAQRGWADTVGDYRGAVALRPPAPDPTRLTDITDGTSNTTLLAEDAGRPRVWQAGKAGQDQGLEGGPWNHFKGPITPPGRVGRRDRKTRGRAPSTAPTTGRSTPSTPAGPSPRSRTARCIS